ncbi:MAG: sugar phosphate isomerase/epimerase [Nitrospirae bacterium]|nr:sugar phosphate isomerase/epimerase [Nitrospirota bacterium]
MFISSQCIRGESIIDVINELSEISPNIELSGGSRYDANLLDRLIEVKEKKDVNLLIHGYFPPPEKHFILNFADTGEKTREFIRETIRFIRAIGIDYYSIHAGFKRDFEFDGELLTNPGDRHYTMEGIQKNIEWFNREFPDVRLAIENLYPNNMNKESCFFMHIDEIVEFLKIDRNTYLLLDLGHLKVSSVLFGFDYLDAAGLLFEKYGSRILEVHLSENNGCYDDHFLVHSDSVQYMIVKKYAKIINNNGINIAIEARGLNMDELFECHFIINEALASHDSRFTIHDSRLTSHDFKRIS